jgi:hypothetical protein
MAKIRHRATGLPADADTHIVSESVRPGELIIVGGDGSLEVDPRTVDEVLDQAQSGDPVFDTLEVTGNVTFSGLPTSNPAVAGRLWNDAGTVKVSAG